MPSLKSVTTVALLPPRLTIAALRSVAGSLGSSSEDQRAPAPVPEAERPRPAARPRSSSRPKPNIDDVALARKVETVIFRNRAVPKGKIDVNAADGVVWLRGEAKTPAMIKTLERQAQAVPEVARVENLLHLPKTPAPTRTDTPAAQRKTRRRRVDPAKRKVSAGKVTAERAVPGAEPSPAELAKKRLGRPPSPLGGADGPSSGA